MNAAAQRVGVHADLDQAESSAPERAAGRVTSDYACRRQHCDDQQGFQHARQYPRDNLTNEGLRKTLQRTKIRNASRVPAKSTPAKEAKNTQTE
jgi:hypothetical protein